MALRSENDWKTHFSDIAGIPEPYAQEYAKTFVHHRLTEQHLAELTNEFLRDDLEITALGDILAILSSRPRTDIPIS